MNLAARCPQEMRTNVRVLCGHLTIMTAWPDHTYEMDQSGDLVPRKAESLVAEALADTRVVTLNGARQVGKSTLARLAARGRPNSVVRLLDDPATLRAAQDDPASFVDHDGLLVIDEVQLAPGAVPVDQGRRRYRPASRAIPAHRIRPGAGVAAAPRRAAGTNGDHRALAVLPGRDRPLPRRLRRRRFAHGPACPGPPPCASATTSNAPSAAATPKRSAGPLAAAPPSSTPT